MASDSGIEFGFGKITDPNHKTRYPKKGVGYEPLGILDPEFRLLKVSGLGVEGRMYLSPRGVFK